MDINLVIEGVGNLITHMSVWVIIGFLLFFQFLVLMLTTEYDENGDRIKSGSGRAYVSLVLSCNALAAFAAVWTKDWTWKFQDWMPAQLVWTLAAYLLVMGPPAVFIVARAVRGMFRPESVE